MSTVSKSDELFRSGSIFDVSDEKLDEVLKDLAGNWDNPLSSTLALSRVAIINTIKQQRHIDKIEGRNQIYTWIIIALTITSIAAQILPLILNCVK